eukprot:3721355-Rhodomonas_salina.1
MVRSAGRALAAELLYGKKDSGLLSEQQESGLSQQLSQQLSQRSELSDYEDRVGVSSVGRTPPRGDGRSLREQVRALLDGRREAAEGAAEGVSEESEKSYDPEEAASGGEIRCARSARA